MAEPTSAIRLKSASPTTPTYATAAIPILHGTRATTPATRSNPPVSEIQDSGPWIAIQAVPFHCQAPSADTAATHCRPSQTHRLSCEKSPISVLRSQTNPRP